MAFRLNIPSVRLSTGHVITADSASIRWEGHPSVFLMAFFRGFFSPYYAAVIFSGLLHVFHPFGICLY